MARTPDASLVPDAPPLFDGFRERRTRGQQLRAAARRRDLFVQRNALRAARARSALRRLRAR